MSSKQTITPVRKFLVEKNMPINNTEIGHTVSIYQFFYFFCDFIISGKLYKIFRLTTFFSKLINLLKKKFFVFSNKYCSQTGFII